MVTVKNRCIGFFSEVIILLEVKEGSLYKIIKTGDYSFNIHYGYHSASEKEKWGPTPIFPDFSKQPIFTKEGNPYTRADQDICEYFKPKPKISGENWCNDCKYFKLYEEVIGVCRCNNRKNKNRQNE